MPFGRLDVSNKDSPPGKEPLISGSWTDSYHFVLSSAEPSNAQCGALSPVGGIQCGEDFVYPSAQAEMCFSDMMLKGDQPGCASTTFPQDHARQLLICSCHMSDADPPNSTAL